MLRLQPALREQPDVQQKLWNHLYIMAGEDLDVDAPVLLSGLSQQGPPSRVSYPTQVPKLKTYGRGVELLIAKAIGMDDEAEREQATITIGRTMKVSLPRPQQGKRQGPDHPQAPQGAIGRQIDAGPGPGGGPEPVRARPHRSPRAVHRAPAPQRTAVTGATVATVVVATAATVATATAATSSAGAARAGRSPSNRRSNLEEALGVEEASQLEVRLR